MAHTTAGGLVALVGTGALALALQTSAHGAGPTFTRITTPTGGWTILDTGVGGTIKVRGKTSSDVTAVDIACLGGPRGDVVATPVATNVPVTAGAFSVHVPLPHASIPVCRMRALPQGTTVNDDVSAFSGPVVHLDRVTQLIQGAAVFDFTLVAGSGSGVMEVNSAGNCAGALMASLPDDLGTPFSFQGCVATLAPTAASSTPLRVDGKVALLPFALLDADDSTLQVSVGTNRNGRAKWVESALLVRCASPGSCGNVVSTGVKFIRYGTFTADGRQIRLRDRFMSTDGRKHRVRTVYGMAWTPPPTGALGFSFPGGKGGFHGSTKGQVVTGYPQRSGTLLVRSDRFADEGDPGAATRAVTWSRPPTRIAFSGSDSSTLGLSYSLAVPKSGVTRLGFTDSDAVRTSTARALGAGEVAGVMRSPTITSPADGAVVVGTKTVVTGVVRAAVNGLPVSVKVNGHPATITATSAGRATYKVVFHESGGQHRLTAVAKDAGGNTRSTSITVRNK